MYSKDILSYALVGSAVISSAAASSEKSRPRGVGPEYAKYYKEPKFSCIFNPSIALDHSQVNDDFCDCPDGSDEPGTSACSSLTPYTPPSVDKSLPNLNHSIALPGFYCKNKGHNPTYIPFTYVNDGVCDYDLCCDGSDEWEGVGGVKCEDKCKELGAQWKKQNEAKQKSRQSALRKRSELVLEASRLRKEVEDRILELEVLIQGDQLRVQDAESELVEVEKQEKLRSLNAPKRGGKLSNLVSVTKTRIEDLRTQLQNVKTQRDEAEYRIKELEDILDQFKKEYNPNFNDEGVKRAVRAWEDYEARGRQSPPDTEANDKIDNLLLDDSQHGITWEDYEKGDESATVYKFEEYLPPSLRVWIHEKRSDLRKWMVENGLLAATEDGDTTESKVLTDARSRLESAKSDLESRKSDLENKQADLTKDYGADEVFRSLKGQCVEVESGEYKYEHCFMDRTTQKPQKGGMDTSMGNFERFEIIEVDEEEPVDGKGLGSGKRVALKYENGAHCWNGPARCTTVILACAEKNEIWKVAEEEKCVYRMEAGSPAACVEDVSQGNGKKGKGKDEL